MTDETEFIEPCGSMRCTEEYEGSVRATVWCDRTEGPCPFPGTRQANDRPCAGGRVLKVKWADEAVAGAYSRLKAFSDELDEGHEPDVTPAIGESLWPALDALRMCLPPGHIYAEEQ